MPSYKIDKLFAQAFNGDEFLSAFTIGIEIEVLQQTIEVVEPDAVSRVADTISSICAFLPHALAPVFVASQRQARSGRVITFPGRVLPPKVTIRLPWASDGRVWFQGEEERGDLFMAFRKFDLRFDAPESPWLLRGCVVLGVIDDGGDAVVSISADVLDTRP